MIKNRLRKLRLSFGFNYSKEFAEYLDVKYVSYIQWETHAVQISLDNLIKIWRRLREKNPKISLHDILDLEDD